jgi:lipoyl(octanoyl) transferase
MAMDHALFEHVMAGGRPVLRLYRWQPACLSFGRNQPARELYSPDIARELGIDIVRRPTGGQAVCHDRELTYAVAVPLGILGRPRQTYVTINRILATALERIGVPARLSEASPADTSPLRLAAGPCFQEAAPGEVVVAGRKLVGSAQRFERRTILQHGSILIDGDQSAVVRIQNGRGVPPGSTGIRQVIGREPDLVELCNAVTQAFAEHLTGTLQPELPGPAESVRVCELVHRYRSDEWTWRR